MPPRKEQSFILSRISELLLKATGNKTVMINIAVPVADDKGCRGGPAHRPNGKLQAKANHYCPLYLPVKHIDIRLLTMMVD